MTGPLQANATSAGPSPEVGAMLAVVATALILLMVYVITLARSG